MDPRSYRDLVAPKITKYAGSVPSSLREDFVQDMWVFALGHLFEAFGAQGLDDREIKGSLDLSLFRARDDWFRQHNHKTRCEVPEEAAEEPFFQPTVQDKVDAGRAVQGLADSLRKARYNDEDILKVVMGFRDGLSQKEIAEQVGRSPQLLSIHLNNFRSAA
jgi:hypothetical protein